MEITVTGTFFNMSSSSAGGDYLLFMAFCMVWIVGAFVYMGVGSMARGLISAVS